MYGKYALHAFAGQRDITALRDAYAQLNADSRFACAKLDVLPELGPAALLALAATNDGYFAPKRLWFNADDPAATLAEARLRRLRARHADRSRAARRRDSRG